MLNLNGKVLPCSTNRHLSNPEPYSHVEVKKIDVLNDCIKKFLGLAVLNPLWGVKYDFTEFEDEEKEPRAVPDM